MKKFLIVMIAGWSMACSAAEKPNFSGEWKLNPEKSAYQGLPPPEKFVRRIEHAEPEITLTEQQSANGQESNSTVSVKTDGHPVTVIISGTRVTVNASWNEESLVVSSDVTNAGLKFRDIMTLSADREELRSKVEVISTQGEIELSLVFDRQR